MPTGRLALNTTQYITAMENTRLTMRPQAGRSLTWPPTVYIPTAQPQTAVTGGQSGSVSATTQFIPAPSFFEDDLESNPQNHFLSPVQMYEYEDWSEESDSDASDIEWDAGITDFALFDSDWRRAKESDEPLPSKWNGVVARQASALQRANERANESEGVNKLLAVPGESVPGLTPDVSPDLGDDLEEESYQDRVLSEPSVPEYLTVIITPPEFGEGIDEDEELPLSFYVARKQAQLKPNRKLQRPGLRHSRTMSGHVHAWRRPGMYTVLENDEGDDEDKVR